MGADMVVALGSATADGATLFGHNRQGPASETVTLQRAPGRSFAPGEVLQAQFVSVPQARQTFTVLGCRPGDAWGYCVGVNEHRVAAGQAAWHSRARGPDPGLTGPDLVRLALERSRTARQALEIITDLVTRHGQSGISSACPRDNVLLISDPHEAYLVEAAGAAWAWLECRDIRAVSDLGLIRQDWQRLSPGLAEHTIAGGWWPDDGSKLDFGSINDAPLGNESALRRWGRASLLLEQQHGHIDAAFLRRLLSDHYEGTRFEVDPLRPAAGPKSICRYAGAGDDTATSASFLAPLSESADQVAMAWCAFGPPCLSVYVPVFLDGELPAAYLESQGAAPAWQPRPHRQRLALQPSHVESWRHAATHLQGRFEEETEEFLPEAARLKQRGDLAGLQRQCTLFMQNHQEQLEAEFYRLANPAGRRPVFSGVE